MMNVRAEAACVVLLKEALLCATLRATDQANRATANPGQHRRRYRCIIVGELAFGDPRFRIDHTLPVAYFDAARRGRRNLLDGGFCLHHNGLGPLILPQPQIAGMAQHALIGHLRICDLCDQARLQPVGAADSRAGCLDRRHHHFQRSHQIKEAGHLAVVETRTDLPRVAQFTVFVDPKQQGAKFTRLVGRGPPYDDEFLSLDAFDFQPATGTGAYIGFVRLLGNYAFKPGGAELVEQLLAASTDVVGIMDVPGC